MPRPITPGIGYASLAVGYDGMAESQAALDEAAMLAGKFGGSMKVIGVMTPIPPAAAAAAAQAGAEVGPDFQTRLHDAVAELPPELRALPVLEQGDPVQKLLEVAEVGSRPACPRLARIRPRHAPADRQRLVAGDPRGALPGDGGPEAGLGLAHA